MKITYDENGTIVRVVLSNVEEMAMLSGLPRSANTEIEVVINANGTATTAHRPAPAAPTMPPAMPTAMPKAKAKRMPSVTQIGTVYITERADEIMAMLKANPDGLTTRQMVLLRHRTELMEMQVGAKEFEAEVERLISGLSGHVSGTMHHFGLSRRISNSLVWKLSELGKIARTEVVKKPAYLNRTNARLNRYITALVAGEAE